MSARRKTKSRRLLLRRAVIVIASIIIMAVAAVVVFVILQRVISKANTTAVIVPVTKMEPPVKIKQKPTSELPVRLSIPSIGVDAVVAHAGLTADGTMDIKPDPDQVAWYQFGTRPGDDGSAVIAGHYGWTGQHGSVFNDINQLKPGDSIYSIDGRGVATPFTVRETRKFDPNADAESVFLSYDHKAHLNLVTCEGIWDNATKSFTNRLVVFSDLKV